MHVPSENMAPFFGGGGWGGGNYFGNWMHTSHSDNFDLYKYFHRRIRIEWNKM